MSEKIYQVKNGDCAWNVAQKQLKSQGKKNVTTQMITKEMSRLAKVNGCKDANEFNQKFFGKIGATFNLEITEKNTTQKPSNLGKFDGFEKKDSTLIQDRDSIRNYKPLYSRIDSTKVDSVKNNPPQEKKTTPTPSVEAQIDNINKIKGDTNRIIEYNKTNAKGNYIIVDKKTCKATVYNKKGEAIESYEVLIGQTKGDRLSTAFAKDVGKRIYTTVPGQFNLSAKTNLHDGTLFMGDINGTFDPDVEVREDAPGSGGKRRFGGGFQAIHGTATKERSKLYKNGNLADNRASMGCVNIPIDKLNEMQEKYGIKVGSELYILPEDKGNELILQKQKDGSVKFITKYVDNTQNEKLARVNDTVTDNKNQKLLAARENIPPKKENEFSFWNPKTWIS